MPLSPSHQVLHPHYIELARLAFRNHLMYKDRASRSWADVAYGRADGVNSLVKSAAGDAFPEAMKKDFEALEKEYQELPR